MKIPDLTSKKSAIIASTLVLITVAIAVTRKTKSEEVGATKEQSAQIESSETNEKNAAEPEAKTVVPQQDDRPLSKKEIQNLKKILAIHKIKENRFDRFDLGPVEAQQIFNDEFRWTKDRYREAVIGVDDGFMFLPLSSLRFIDKKSKKTIAQLRIDVMDDNCSESINVANIDVSTPWPEFIYSCVSKGSGGSTDTLVFSVTPDKKIIMNKELSDSFYLDKLSLTGNAEIRPAQINKGFLNTAFYSGDTIISRSTREVLSEGFAPNTPVFWVVAQPPVKSLRNCEQCKLRPMSVVALENGTWKDANKEPAALKYFESSVAEIDKNLEHYFDTKNFKPDEEDFRLRTINEAQFLRLAHSIRLGRGAEAWKEMNKRFNEKFFDLCDGEKNCEFPNWQAEIKSELEARGFDASELK
jgi:hypothetical protein